jgi:hypothetical protein
MAKPSVDLTVVGLDETFRGARGTRFLGACSTKNARTIGNYGQCGSLWSVEIGQSRCISLIRPGIRGGSA